MYNMLYIIFVSIFMVNIANHILVASHTTMTTSTMQANYSTLNPERSELSKS